MKCNYWDYAYLLCIAGIVLCLDQGSKLMVRSYIQPGDSWMPYASLSPYLRIVHNGNTGIALGLFRSTNGLFIALSEIACIAILLLYPRLSLHRNVLVMGSGLGLLLGGAAGNLVDRISVGYVTDILLVNLFPVFNLADLCIILGIILIAIGLLNVGDGQKVMVISP